MPLLMGDYFTAAERLACQPVWSDEYSLHSRYAPESRLLDECRRPVWWTPTGLVTRGPSDSGEEIGRPGRGYSRRPRT